MPPRRARKQQQRASSVRKTFTKDRVALVESANTLPPNPPRPAQTAMGTPQLPSFYVTLTSSSVVHSVHDTLGFATRLARLLKYLARSSCQRQSATLHSVRRPHRLILFRVGHRGRGSSRVVLATRTACYHRGRVRAGRRHSQRIRAGHAPGKRSPWPRTPSRSRRRTVQGVPTRRHTRACTYIPPYECR